MTLHLHHLTGCAPAPLAHYLKALAVLRLVAEQKDPDARGFWQDEHFCLLTVLDRDALEGFFLDEYRPTPFVSPWNKGAGFFKRDDPGLMPIEQSLAPRFADFRRGIAAARARIGEITAADAIIREFKARRKEKKGMTPDDKRQAVALRVDPDFRRDLAAAERRFKELKEDLFGSLLRDWRGPHRAWLDAALVVPEAGRPVYPALLGTGGNDGNFDFTNNAMQRIQELFEVDSRDGRARPIASSLLRHALWGDPSHELGGASVGQFLPGSAGGANSTTGSEGPGVVNPWDFVFVLEGTLLFSARATRRLDPAASSQASAPFAVRAHPVGYGTVGGEKIDRGEQWMPLWNRPSSIGALCALLGEARMQLGRRVAHRPIDAAGAIARLGVARGVTGFARFGYAERFGQSKMAVPLGRIDVQARPRARLVDDIAPWIDRLRREAQDGNAPARLVHAERRAADAVFSVLTHDDAPQRWQYVLLAAAAVETIQAAGAALRAGPIPRLSEEWVLAGDDGSSEWRLACALGSAAGSYGSAGRPRDRVRHHWLALEPNGVRFLVKDKRLVNDPRVVAIGRDDDAALAAVVQRRLIESSQRGQRYLPMVAAPRLAAHPADLAALVAGRVDVARVVALARALMAVGWRSTTPGPTVTGQQRAWPDEPWIAIRLACLPWPLDEQRSVSVDEAIIRRLQAGDASAAVEIALRRLHAAGLRAPIRGACADPATARLWLAALAFPITRNVAQAMARRFDPQQTKEKR